MLVKIEQKLTHFFGIPVLILFVLWALNVDWYWYCVAVGIFILVTLRSHKQLEVDSTKVYFKNRFNPFRGDRYLAIEKIRKVIYVDRKNAHRQSAYQRSYFRFFTAENHYVTYSIILSDGSVKKVLNVLEQLNIPTEITTKDLDQDQPRRKKYRVKKR